MTSSDSFSRLTRCFDSGEPRPNVAISAATEPQPMPSSKRPFEAWSRETASRASMAGWRKESHSTSEPTLRLLVRPATQVLATIGSNMAWLSASGGARWSMPAMPWKPAASAAWARSTIWSMVRRIWGR